MKNYFENADVDWNIWSPEDVIFKNGKASKKLMPQDNVLGYSSKGDRNVKMGKRQPNGHKAVHVWLKHTDNDFPSAHIDFLDWSKRTYSNGRQANCLDVLVYIDPLHSAWDWQQVNGNWARVSKGNPLPTEEGYKIAYGGQGDNNPMTKKEFIELVEISEAVRRFLIDVVIGSRDSNTIEMSNDYAIA